MLERVWSGGQTGADVGGLMAAKRFGIKTGGYIPKGCITSSGPRPDWGKEYGLTETSSAKYAPRTFQNVKETDGTLRLAFNFSTPGELCTVKAIRQYEKPSFDVDLKKPCPVADVVAWLEKHDIKVLNVAGNSEVTHQGTTGDAYEYMCELFKALGFQDIENT